MPSTDAEQLVRRFVDGDPAVVGELAAYAGADPVLLVAAALAAPPGRDLLRRAGAAARDAGERRLVAIAATYLAGDVDRAGLLARDHLADHPDSPLAAHLAAQSEKRTR
jgi:hypothetical protein